MLAVGVRLEATMFRLMKSVYCASIFSGCSALGFSGETGRERTPNASSTFFRFLVKSKSRENEKSYLRNCIWEKHG
jgi:hypothetical protein